MVKLFVIFTILASSLISCSTDQIQQASELAKRIERERQDKKEREKPTPTPTPPITSSPTPIPAPPITIPIIIEPILDPKVKVCSRSGQIVKSHHGPQDDCRIGSEKRGCSALQFTGRKGGLECLASDHSDVPGELKCGLPWDFDCNLAQEVKVCGPKGCRTADKSRAQFVNYDLASQGKMCTQWHRWRQSAATILRETGEPVVLHVGGCKIKWCTEQWRREKRCS